MTAEITTISDAFSESWKVLQLCLLAALVVCLGLELRELVAAIRSRWGGSNSHGFTQPEGSNELTDSDEES